MEATCSSETSVDFQWTTRRYIPDDRTLLSIIRCRKVLLRIYADSYVCDPECEIKPSLETYECASTRYGLVTARVTDKCCVFS
jgi:hypothetical protein